MGESKAPPVHVACTCTVKQSVLATDVLTHSLYRVFAICTSSLCTLCTSIYVLSILGICAVQFVDFPVKIGLYRGDRRLFLEANG